MVVLGHDRANYVVISIFDIQNLQTFMVPCDLDVVHFN